MQDLMRKHRKALLAIIVLTIGIPMLFFGIPEFWKSSKGGNDGKVLATVGDVPIYQEEFVQALSQTATQRSQGGKRPTVQELDASGAAQETLQNLITQALFSYQVKQRDLQIDDAYAAEQLRKFPMFKTKDGKFDPEEFRAWVQNMQDRGTNWNELYSNVENQVAHQVLLSAISAPAGRVFEQDIQQELEDGSTKIQMKYAVVEPPVEVTEEEIQKQYADNQANYKTPDKRVAEYVAYSLAAEAPQKALDLVTQLRGGGDFAALANEHSDLTAPDGAKVTDGGDMGWRPESNLLAEPQSALKTLTVGQVSDPVSVPGGYYILKLEEERTNADNGERELHGRQIFVKADITPEQRAERMDRAKALLAKAKETGDLAAAAQADGLQVQQAGPFDSLATELAGIPRADLRGFTTGLGSVAAGAFGEVINGRSNVYVAKVTDLQAGTIPPMEEVRAKVSEDALNAKKQTPEYATRVQEYAEKIKTGASSLEDAAAKFPELKLEVKTSREFTKKDFLFQDQIFVSTEQIYSAIGHGEPGVMGGPVTDFQGKAYFFELLKKTPPTDEEKAKWEDERKQIRDQKMMMAERDLLEDYQTSMRQRLMAEVPIEIDQAAMSRILGREEGTITTTPDEAAPAADDAAETDAAPATPAQS